MGIKKQLNVRIPLELQEKIDNDGRPKVEIVVEGLELYFASKKQPNDSNYDKMVNNSNNNASQNDSNIGKIEQNDSNYAKTATNNPSQNDNNVSKIEQKDSNEISRMKTEIDFLRAKIDDLLKLLHQEQVLHIQTQRMLTAPQSVKKKWWQFWS